MDLNERIELAKRNTVEIVKEQELKDLLEEKKQPVVYCGYEPSGEFHLGHLVTAQKLSDLEKAGCKVKVLFADWHAFLNKKGTWEFIHETSELWEKVFSKAGLEKPEFVLGSSFQMSNAYLHDLMTLSLNTTLNRALRAMQEVARDVENATVSQMIYPLMQINDIKYLEVDIAQGGMEQRKIHMLGREIMDYINYKKPVAVHTPLIESLLGPGKKMSSSIPESFISVRDSEEEIGKKLKKAYCNEGEIEGNPVLQILKMLVFPKIKKFKVERPKKFGGDLEFSSYPDLEKSFENKELHPMDLKNATKTYLADILKPMRKIFEK